ncbi:MAG: hypothetical protein ACOZNI_37685 [Myxococcota bacterium]
MIAWLLACGEAGPWSREAALAPAVARLDRDGDGRVVAAEYERVRLAGPPFSEADADGDGALDLDELDALRAAQDPVTFTPMLAGAPPAPVARPPAPPADDTCPRVAALAPAQRHRRKHDDVRFVEDVLETLRAEVVAAAPAVPVPEAACVTLAAELGGLDDAPARLVLRELEAASREAGVAFPAVLAD